MTSVRKRKMNRSSVAKNTRRVKDKQRDINIHLNPIIAANWDKSLTLKQNYKKLGLTAKLGHAAGGLEQKARTYAELKAERLAQEAAQASVEDIENTSNPEEIPEGEARIIRDESGNVEKIIYGTKKAVAATKKTDSEVVKQLEEYAKKNSEIKHERKQSDREHEWCRALFEKYGDDYDKMKWDKKLNPMQQSSGDLRRRLVKWRKAQGV